MTITCPTVHSLLAPILHANPDVIGIDGLDGCRKSDLACRIAGHIHYQVINLDDFLDKNKGSYVDHIDVDGVRDAIRGKRSIIEGVCLLHVIELASLKLDFSIYVQRRRLGLWADEDWLGLDQDVDEYLEKLNVTSLLISGDNESDSDINLSEEIIRYHHTFHPHESADMTFVWNDS